MSTDSIGATIYNTWQIEFFKSLFKKYTQDLDDRMSIFGNYAFNDFFQRLVLNIHEDPTNEHFNRICEGGFKEYRGKQACGYNIARAFSETKKFLEKEVSPRERDWEWGSVHVNEYAN